MGPRLRAVKGDGGKLDLLIPKGVLTDLTQKVALAAHVSSEQCQPFRPEGAEDFYVSEEAGDWTMVFIITRPGSAPEYWRVSQKGESVCLGVEPEEYLEFLRAYDSGTPEAVATLARLLTGGTFRKNGPRAVAIALGIAFGILGFSTAVLADTLVNQDITQDAHWTKAGSPYQVFTDETKAIVVHEKATLTIDPGVVVQFSHDSGLDVKGKLMALGKKDERITFTSLHDQKNPKLGTPWPGDWYGLLVRGDFSRLEYVHIKYAGEPGFQGKAPAASVTLMGRFVHLTNSIIEQGEGNGLWLYFYRHGLVHHNRIEGHSGHGVWVMESVADLFDNLIQSNEKNGVVIEGEGDFRGNLIRNNGKSGLVVKAPRRAPYIHDNTIYQNARAELEILAGRPRLHHNVLHDNKEEVR